MSSKPLEETRKARTTSARADRRSPIEHHTPASIRLEPPDGIEPCGHLALRISDRPAGRREGAGVDDLHQVRFPGERRLWAVEEPLPRLGDCTPAAKDLGAAFVAEKDRLF